MVDYNRSENNPVMQEKIVKLFKPEKKRNKYIEQKELFIMIIPCMIITFIFCYLPLKGWIMAFENFLPYKGYLGSPWVGLDQFKFLLQNPIFWQTFRNTVCMSLLTLFFGTVCAIGFALLLNEIGHKLFKSITQTISYLPHFLSWVIVCQLIQGILSTGADGTLNNVLMGLGIIQRPILWLGEPKYFWWVNTFANIWKEVVWDSIIYLAAMSTIDPELYESCEIDGGNRYTKMWHITLPGIRTTILLILIMKVGWVLNGLDFQYLVGNKGLVLDVSQTIDIFVLKYGIKLGNYSLATAAGLFKSVISIALVAYTNHLAGKLDEGTLL